MLTFFRRFLTSRIWQTLSFTAYFQRRFRQGPHQNLKKNNNCQFLGHKCIGIYYMYHSLCLFVSFDLASSKVLKRYSVGEFADI